MQKESTSLTRDGSLVSPWQTSLNKTQPGQLQPDKLYDALIVGGGLTGVTTALLLQDQGVQTILVDAHSIGYGTSGGTSAHINTFADTTYPEAESAFGEQGAQLFANAIKEGCHIIRHHVETYHIDCDLEFKPGYLYVETDEEEKLLDEIYAGAVKVGVPVTYTNAVPTPVPYKKALLWDEQAQFHPLKYLQALVQQFISKGGVVLEDTGITEVKSGDGVHTAKTNTADIKARAVVYATHMPPGLNLFNFECAPYRSYVLAVKLVGDDYPEGLIYDSQEPYHYVRTHIVNGQKLLLVGGNDHKTGHDEPDKAFADLEAYTRQYYNVSSVEYRWSSQYYVPVDGLPYIGQMPFAADGIYCATGYSGNGMMFSSIAGKILSDLILQNANPYADLFSPSRIKPVDSFTEFVKENADAAYRFVADRVSIDEIDSLKQLPKGTGKVVEFDGKKIAAYRDDMGAIHTLSPVCTHAGCIVAWNGQEKSWDCPCHGARYDINGQVITGPATKPLTSV